MSSVAAAHLTCTVLGQTTVADSRLWLGLVVGAGVGAGVVALPGLVVGAGVGAAVVTLPGAGVVAPPPQPCKTTATPHTTANALIMVDFIFATSQ